MSGGERQKQRPPAPPPITSPKPVAESTPGFGRSHAAPSPARFSPPPPLPAALGEPGRAAPPPAAASGAPRRPEERHGAPTGRDRGLGGRTCEWTERRRRSAAASGPKAAEAPGAGEGAGVARGGPETLSEAGAPRPSARPQHLVLFQDRPP